MATGISGNLRKKTTADKRSSQGVLELAPSPTGPDWMQSPEVQAITGGRRDVQAGLSTEESLKKLMEMRRKGAREVPAEWQGIPWPEYRQRLEEGKLGPGQFMGQEPSLTDIDVMKAQIVDREAQRQALEGQLGAVTQGIGLLGEARAAAGPSSELQENLRAFRGGMAGVPEEAKSRQLAGLGEVRRGVAELGEQAQARGREGLEALEERERTALGEYQNMTAASIQQQRQAIDLQAQQQLDAAAQEYGIDSPQYKQTAAQVRMQAVQARGAIAAQIGTAYNQARLDARKFYDNLATVTKQTYDQLTGQAQVSQGQLGVLASQVEKTIDDAYVNNKKTIELGTSALEMAANELYQRGSTAEANMLLNYAPGTGIGRGELQQGGGHGDADYRRSHPKSKFKDDFDDTRWEDNHNQPTKNVPRQICSCQ